MIRKQNNDKLYGPALRAVCERGMASTALLQYQLQISYATAAYLIQRMEDEGLIGPADRDRPRQVHAARLRRAIDALPDVSARDESAA